VLVVQHHRECTSLLNTHSFSLHCKVYIEEWWKLVIELFLFLILSVLWKQGQITKKVLIDKVLHSLLSSVWDTFRGGAKPDLGSMNLGVWSLIFELGSLEFDLLNLSLWNLIFELRCLSLGVFGIWCNLPACRKGVQLREQQVLNCGSSNMVAGTKVWATQVHLWDWTRV
jgi:hypothetical protein